MSYRESYTEDIVYAEEKAFREIFDYYFEKVYHLSIRYIRKGNGAEEAAMDIMFKLWKNRDRIRQVENKDGYVFKLTHNSIINILRKKSEQIFTIDLINEEDQPADDQSPLQALYGKELHTVYENAVLTLPAKRQRIFMMHREQNLSAAEIASILGISPRTVEHQISSALHTIREAMKQYGILILPFIVDK